MYGGNFGRFGQVQIMCGPAGCDNIDYSKRLAFWAKMELLKEKVKQKMDAKHGQKLDKLADLIVEVVEDEAKGFGELEKKEEELDDAFAGVYSEEPEEE